MPLFSLRSRHSPQRDGVNVNDVSWSRSPADANAKCSLLLCGPSRSATLASSLQWSIGPVPDPRVKTANLEVPGGSITLFRHAAGDNENSAAIPPYHVHKPLNLWRCNSGFLFVHDASDPDVERSIRCLRRYLELPLRYGSRGFWVVISSPSNAKVHSELAELVFRFESELSRLDMRETPEEVGSSGRRVLEMTVVDAARLVGDAMLTDPRLFRPRIFDSDGFSWGSMDKHFRHAFLKGEITPWRHRDYIRAAYLALVEPDNRGLGLLEVATKFAAQMDEFKQHNSQFQLQPESRTLTVFWLYQVKLAVAAMLVFRRDRYHPLDFQLVFHYMPELTDEQLHTIYYSPDILRSENAKHFWMLPNLRELVEPPQYPDFELREKLAEKQHEDPDRLLRLVFAMVQRYLRPGETRRRSWFINLAFAALQQQTTRLRSTRPWISAYSETQSYFYLQLVHAALSQLTSTGKTEAVQAMSYPLFKERFRISPSVWTAYYSPQLWDSVAARAAFVPPDLMPLPDTIHPPSFYLEPTLANPNEHFQKLGLIPELPSLEILRFHQAILLEDAKPLKPTITPTEVTSHAHLVRYIHTHLILPPLPSPDESFSHHHTLLTTASPLPKPHITFYLTLALRSLTPLPAHLSHTNPTTSGELARDHNCPCRRALALPDETGPDDAVSRPTSRRTPPRGVPVP